MDLKESQKSLDEAKLSILLAITHLVRSEERLGYSYAPMHKAILAAIFHDLEVLEIEL